MELFGIGPLELLFILLLALIIFGPRDIEKAARSLGRTLYQFTHSETWRTITQASRKIRNFPDELLREAEKEELDRRLASGEVTRQDWKQDPHIQPVNPGEKSVPPPDPNVVDSSGKKTTSGGDEGGPGKGE